MLSAAILRGRVIFRTHSSGDAILEIERECGGPSFPASGRAGSMWQIDDVMDVVVSEIPSFA